MIGKPAGKATILWVLPWALAVGAFLIPSLLASLAGVSADSYRPIEVILVMLFLAAWLGSRAFLFLRIHKSVVARIAMLAVLFFVEASMAFWVVFAFSIGSSGPGM
jgi:hypothetical protein